MGAKAKGKRDLLVKSSMALALSLAEGEGGAPAAPEWIQLFPAPAEGGVIEARASDGRRFVMRDADAVIAATNRRRVDLMLDYDHQSEKATRWDASEARAAGWIPLGGDALQVREDGSVWGRPEYTPRGAAAVADREYRYISPAFLHDDEGVIFEITSVALVNNPAFAMRALASHEDPRPPSRQENDMKLTDEALAKLGLDKGATEDQINAAIAGLELKPEPSPEPAPAPAATATASSTTEVVPAADLALAQDRASRAEAELAELRAEGFGRDVDAVLDKAIAEGRIAPASREYHRASCFHGGKPSQEGLERLKAYAEKAAPVAPTEPKVGGKEPPEGQPATAGLTKAQLKRAEACGISPEDYAKSLAALKAQTEDNED